MSGTLTFDDISTVIVNYRAPDLLQSAATSFRKCYLGIDLLVVDKGSNDQSGEVTEHPVQLNPGNTKSMMLGKNYYYGSAMDQAMGLVHKETVILLGRRHGD
jgi:GT2 family glycosyltransferase